MSLYFLVVGFFLLGYVLQKISPFSRQLVPYLNHYIICLAVPALILFTIPDVSLEFSYIFALAIPWGIFLTACLVLYPLSNKLGWSKEIKVAVLLLIVLGNTAFLGVPLVGHVFGGQALLSAIVYDQLGSFLLLTIVATALIANTQRKADVGKEILVTVFLKIIRFPPFISLILAFFIPSSSELGYALPVLKLRAMTILPIAMIVIGLQFEFRIEKAYRLPVMIALGGKMIVSPIIVFFVGTLLAVHPMILASSIMQSAMPPMITAVILLVAADITPKFAAVVLGIGTLLSGLTLPILIQLVHYFVI